MAVIINNIRQSIEQPKEAALAKGEKLIKRFGAKIKEIHIGKVSLDARKKNEMSFVYSLVAEIEGDSESFVKGANHPDIRVLNTELSEFVLGDKALNAPPVVVGFGPSGIFAALTLAKHGYNPIVIERGGDMSRRVSAVEGFWNNAILDLDSNVQFGEGGAGTFSDGKLTTRVKDKNLPFVLNELVKHGAPKGILFDAKPHVGTDMLRGIVVSIREEIISLGGKVIFESKLEDICIENGGLSKIKYSGEWQEVSAVILGIGHSARDTFYMLKEKGVAVESKPFSVGVRAEHLQSEIDKGLYGDMANHPLLKRGEYQLSHREGKRAVYTFCMCPGGVVVPSASESESVVVNGMSYHARDGVNANSAIAVSVDSTDFGNDWDAGIVFQRKLEKAAFNSKNPYKAPIQTLNKFLAGKGGADIRRVSPSYCIGSYESDFSGIFPEKITEMLKMGFNKFDRKLNGFAAADTVLTGVETRTSSPIRIVRNEKMQSVNTEGLYPTGEGAGYAGGIMSAALDGIKAASAVMNIYKPYDL